MFSSRSHSRNNKKGKKMIHKMVSRRSAPSKLKLKDIVLTLWKRSGVSRRWCLTHLVGVKGLLTDSVQLRAVHCVRGRPQWKRNLIMNLMQCQHVGIHFRFDISFEHECEFYLYILPISYICKTAKYIQKSHLVSIYLFESRFLRSVLLNLSTVGTWQKVELTK